MIIYLFIHEVFSVLADRKQIIKNAEISFRLVSFTCRKFRGLQGALEDEKIDSEAFCSHY